MKKTKNINPIEADYSKFIRDNFDGWVERVERGRGMNDGYPDLSMLLPSGLELVELKVGSVVDGVLWCEEVRPSQISFHHRLADNGGRSFFLVGVWVGDGWRSFAFDGTLARHWETTGYRVGDTCFEIDNRNLFESLTDFVYEQLEN